jgi:hypothetical protein
MTQQPKRDSEIADALHAMSAGGLPDEVEAELREQDPSDDPDAASAETGEVRMAEVLDETDAIDAPVIPGASGFADPSARRQRAAAMERRTRQVHMHQLKVFMIPLLLTVGGLLMLSGIFILATGSGARSGTAFVRSFSQWYPLAALPLGAILLAGAWWFRREIQDSQRP